MNELVPAELPNHRYCTDEEYNTQRRCWTCQSYSFKSYANRDENSGKCFGLFRPDTRGVKWTEGKQICDLFVHDGITDDGED